MGFRFHKRFSIIPGLRLNLGKRGASLSVGRRGAWLTAGPRGMRATAGIPGTGLSWTQTFKSKGAAQPATSQRPAPRETVITVPRDRADEVCQSLEAHGYKTELRPHVEPKSRAFVWFCAIGFMTSFLFVLLIKHA